MEDSNLYLNYHLPARTDYVSETSTRVTHTRKILTIIAEKLLELSNFVHPYGFSSVAELPMRFNPIHMTVQVPPTCLPTTV